MNQPVIKWTGSKRSQAKNIVSLMPKDYRTYFELFLGGGSVLYEANPNFAVCNDICQPLIEFYRTVQTNPLELYKQYKSDWELFNQDTDYYYKVRERFNKDKDPYSLLFLTRTCINGKIRFNKKGEFNVSVHYGRKGINPETLKKILMDWHYRLQNVWFMCDDYRNYLDMIKKDDFCYLDPPYFNTVGMYYGGIDYDDFIDFLRQLNKKGVKYVLSYDGVRGNESKIVDLPDDVYCRHELLLSGNSSFDRFRGEKKVVYESVYMNYE